MISAIVILAAVLFVTLMPVITRRVLAHVDAGRRNSCEALLDQLKLTMKTYQQVHGAFPPGPGPFPGMKTPVLDPWGQPLVFRHVGVISSRDGTTLKVITWNEYRIHSVGPNGIDEGGIGDDIGDKD